LHAAIGILAALRHRDRTGDGQLVEVDLLSTTLFALVNQASNWLTAGVVAGRMGNRHPSIAPYETLRAADGPFVVAVGNDEQFATFCDVLDVSGLATDARFATNAARVTNREPLVEALERALAAASASAWIERLGARGIPCGMVNQVDQAFELARAVGLDAIASVQGVDTVANPLRLSRTPATYRMRPPGLGEHDAEVRAEAES
jgi:crotonobetainyl-CoA:carnitine CoA-transferase CaiB-like acyl-CoA transferase